MTPRRLRLLRMTLTGRPTGKSAVRHGTDSVLLHPLAHYRFGLIKI